MDDEEIPYRSPIDLANVIEAETYSKDEEEQSTLRRVHKILKDAATDIDKWHAFDLTESELKLKQQIKAHAMAMTIVGPALEAVEQALATIDDKFRQRNAK